MGSQAEDQKSEENYLLLQSYRIDDVEKPQIILRKFCHANNHEIDKDDLLLLSLDMTNPNEDIQKMLPSNFGWALQSLKTFKTTYKRMLAEPNERIHLEGIEKKDSYIILEDMPEKTDVNTNSGEYIGGCAYMNNRPCIVLVNGKIKDTTFLHESVHHSDLMLSSHHFSNLPVYQTIIMLIDAQASSSGKNNKTVQSLRTVNRLYKPGQLYIEGLPWITEMPMADLYQEKNHLGQSLKLLHTTYTKAVLEEKYATLDCFEFFKSSPELQLLLKQYNSNGQKIINNGNRKQILKQQTSFTEELLKFRREIGNIERAGLDCQKLPNGTAELCGFCGFNSLTPAVVAFHNASDLYDRTKSNNGMVVDTLQKLQSRVQSNGLTNISVIGQDLLTAYFYMEMADQRQNGYEGEIAVTQIPNALKQKTPDEIRKRFYDSMNKNISLMTLAYQTNCSKRDCELALALNTTPDFVKSMRKIVEHDFAGMKNLTQKREAVSSLIVDFELNPDRNEAELSRIKAALAMETFLAQSVADTHIHGALSQQDLKNFDISKKILQDMKYIQTDENMDGLPLNTYQNFDLGYIAELCERDASCFDKNSPNYIPNNYQSATQTGTAYAQALYELVSLRHFYGYNAPKTLALASFKPNVDFYIQKNQNKTYASVSARRFK